MNNLNHNTEDCSAGKGLSPVNSIAISIVTILFFFIGCFWMLFSVLSFSKAETTSSAPGRDLTTEYINNADHVKIMALDGVYSINPTYSIPETQIIASKPHADGFGSADSKEDIVSIAQQAEEFGLIDSDELVFLNESTPCHPEVKPEYYLDKTIFSVSWKAVKNYNVYNFTEVVIGHPSQFRKYLTENTFSSGKRKTVSTMSKELNAVIGMSADFYAYRHSGIVVYGGELYRNNYLTSYDNCFITREGEMILAPRRTLEADKLEDYIKQSDISFSISFGPILVEDGEISKYSRGDYIVGEPTDNYARSAIGQLGKLHYLLCTVDGGTSSMGKYREGITVNDLALMMKNMGCEKAYTMDGGQTATMTVNGNIFNRVGYGSERPVSDLIFFATALPDGVTTEDGQ